MQQIRGLRVTHVLIDDIPLTADFEKLFRSFVEARLQPPKEKPAERLRRERRGGKFTPKWSRW